MSGNRGIVVAACGLLAAGCARNVKQDAHTGSDGRYKGAKPIALSPTQQAARHEGATGGIVTYPGGDRVDWKLVEIPEGKNGKLEISLGWRAPRPGLDLAFDVYNEYGKKLGGVKAKKPAATRKSTKVRGKKSLTLEDVKGKIYIEVYASNRGDAGKYALSVAFLDETRTIITDPTPPDAPPPPKLATVYPPCNLDEFDRGNPDCKGKQPAGGGGGPPEPAKVCPNPQKPDAALAECYDYFEECTAENWSKTNPKCEDVERPVAPPIDAMIQNVGDTSGSGWTDILIRVGSEQGLSSEWTGKVFDNDGKPLKGGEITITLVFKDHAQARVKLKKSVLQKNLTIELYPPVTAP